MLSCSHLSILFFSFFLGTFTVSEGLRNLREASNQNMFSLAKVKFAYKFPNGKHVLCFHSDSTLETEYGGECFYGNVKTGFHKMNIASSSGNGTRFLKKGFNLNSNDRTEGKLLHYQLASGESVFVA